MLVNHTDFLWKKETVEPIALTTTLFSFIPDKPMRVYKFDSDDYDGEIAIFESEDAENPLYQGTLPFIPQTPIAFDGLVFLLPDAAEPTDETAEGEPTEDTPVEVPSVFATISVTAEVGTLKAVLEPYLNTTEGMDFISNSYNDDGTYSTTGLASFKFNGAAVNTVYISSNHWLGFGSGNEQLKICRRDGCSTAIYRQLIESESGLQILKIRFEGYTVYSNRVESNRLVFEVFLISNDDMFLNVIRTPTSGNYGESCLVCNGTVMALNVNIGSPDGAMISFYHMDENGFQWDIRYEMYRQAGVETQLYLLRLGDDFYTAAEDTLIPVEITDLNALAFMEYGFEKIPSAERMASLSSTQLYLWESGETTTPVKAVLKAYPYPQVLDTVADMSHITILGIKLLTAEYSGNVGVRYSVDDGQNYCVEMPLPDFLNLDPVALWESLPESRRLYLHFILHDNATLSRFKITYEN